MHPHMIDVALKYHKNNNNFEQGGTVLFPGCAIHTFQGFFLTLLGSGPVPVPSGKIVTYCSKLGISTLLITT